MRAAAICLWVLIFAGPAVAQTPGEWLVGGDITTLAVSERQGFKFFDGGRPGSFLEIARRHGWNVLRVRLWVAPDPRPESAAANLENVTLLGQRIKAAGFRFLLDLHYSDSWADPGNQKKPAAWANLPFPALVQQVHDYTRDAVAHLAAHGAAPDIVQVGNEIKNGLLFGGGLHGAGPLPGGGFWERDGGGVVRALRLLAAGAAGAREGLPQAPPSIMLHVPDGQNPAFIRSFFTLLETRGRGASPPVKPDYDLIGLSYYPAQPWDPKIGFEPWHLGHLVESMDYLAATLHKPLMVVETGWPARGAPPSMPGAPEYPFTPAGQVQFYEALLRAVRSVPQGLGRGVVLWTENPYDRNSVFDPRGNALPAVEALGQPR